MRRILNNSLANAVLRAVLIVIVLVTAIKGHESGNLFFFIIAFLAFASFVYLLVVRLVREFQHQNNQELEGVGKGQHIGSTAKEKQ